MRLLLLAGEGVEDRLDRSHPAKVDRRHNRRECAVDEGTVYDHVYVVEAVLENGDPRRYGYTYETKRLTAPPPGTKLPNAREDFCIADQGESIMPGALSNESLDPRPFSISLSGTVNDVPVTIEGNGVIRSYGVYEGVLNFDALPPDFHPTAISPFVVSICCHAYAGMRNGGLNIMAMGATGYSTRRVLTFNNDEKMKTIRSL